MRRGRFGLVRGLLLAGLVLGAGLAEPLLAAAGFRVLEAAPRLEQDVWRLDARVEYGFSDQALEALANGVPLTIRTQIQIRRASAWLWEDSLLDLQLRQAIRYRPLSERYEVYPLPGFSGRAFATRDAALEALGRIANLELLPAERLDPDEDYVLRIRVALDIEELPLPLRPLAYLQDDWKLSSGWTRWPLEP